jgi:hypothetical protein
MRPEYRLRSIIDSRHLNPISRSEAICKPSVSQSGLDRATVALERIQIDRYTPKHARTSPHSRFAARCSRSSGLRRPVAAMNVDSRPTNTHWPLGPLPQTAPGSFNACCGTSRLRRSVERCDRGRGRRRRETRRRMIDDDCLHSVNAIRSEKLGTRHAKSTAVGTCSCARLLRRRRATSASAGRKKKRTR